MAEVEEGSVEVIENWKDLLQRLKMGSIQP